jgi:GNAT superfamily N-acetyltransferase
MSISYREATPQDIPAMHRIRLAVKENVLSSPERVQEAHYLPFLTMHGKGWVALMEDEITGFAIVDTLELYVWALFIHPDWEARGMGKELQSRMLDWYFEHFAGPLWLSTGPDTRAERFYEHTGWCRTGRTSSGEWRFEMDRVLWKENRC